MVRGQLWAVVLMAKEEELRDGCDVFLHAFPQGNEAFARLSELKPSHIMTRKVVRADAVLIKVGGAPRFFQPFLSDKGFVLAHLIEEPGNDI